MQQQINDFSIIPVSITPADLHHIILCYLANYVFDKMLNCQRNVIFTFSDQYSYQVM